MDTPTPRLGLAFVPTLPPARLPELATWAEEAGRVIAAGPPDAVRDDPAVTRAYLGADVDEDGEPDTTVQDASVQEVTA